MTWLEHLRKQEKLTQNEMADELDVSVSFYSKIENGDRLPSRDFLTKVKKRFPLFDMNIFFTEQLHTKCD